MIRQLDKLSILLFVTLLFSSGIAHVEEPENLYKAKQAAIYYHDSGEYDYDLGLVAQQAKAYLEERIVQNSNLKQKRRLAVIFDIDETSLSNYQHMVDLNFGMIPELVIEDIENADDPAITSILKLYNFAKQQGVAVFFITGRTAKLRAVTEKNLKSVGYNDWDGLFLRPNNYDEKSIIPFKSSTRKEIRDKGYDIVVNIGDQYSDLAGGHAEMAFKLPNPYYYIP
jgi:acid phosphatase